MTTDVLLKAMADGEFHSGEELGHLMSVSRTAVWKQIKKLEDMGLLIESVKGRGYRMPDGLDLLDEQAIVCGLSVEAAPLISTLEVLGVVSSTNMLAMERAVKQSVSGHVITAEQQTAGRGRRGKQWLSPFGTSIYLSVVWEFAGGAASLEGLSLAVGVAVVESLSEVGVEGVQLKWPNDVLCEGRKLAGILLEMTGDAAGPCQVVVGIGLNVTMPSDIGSNIDQPWIDVTTISGQRQSRSRVLANLLNKLLPMLASYERVGFAGYRDRWHQLDAFSGQQVFVTVGKEVLTGKEAGVDSTGALLLDTVSGQRQFSGGEISLRRVDDT